MDEQARAAFVSALWGRDEGCALAAQPGFAVYRNSAHQACRDALLANYPALLTLVGEDWLAGAAGEFVRAHPPTDARLMYYGADFADFLASFAPAAPWPWLAAVATLDRLWLASHLAADAPPACAAALASLQAATALAPHPAARWLWHPTLPLWQLWSSARAGLPPGDIVWQGQGVLLTRPHGAVIAQAVPYALCAFLDALEAEPTVGAAASALLAQTQDVDFAALMHTLAEAGALVEGTPDD